MQEAGTSDGRAIAGLLRSARSRWRSRNLLLGLCWWCVIATVMLLGAVLLRWLEPGFPAGERWAWLLPTLAGCVAGGVALTAVWAMRATPDLGQMAWHADRRFGLRSRLETAYELRGGTAPPTVVAALLEDAEDHLWSVDLRALVPLRLPRFLWLVPVILSIAVGFDLWIEPMLSPAAPGSGSELTGLERTAELVGQVASLLELDQATRADPYLAAVTDGFRDLADRLVRGEVDAGNVGEELGNLLQQLAQATRAAAPEVAAVIDQVLGGGSSTGSPPRAAAGPADAPAVAEQAPVPPSPALDEGHGGERTVEDVFRALGAALDALERRQEAAVQVTTQPRPQVDVAQPGGPQGSYLDRAVSAGEELEGLLAALGQEAVVAGAPVGAAEQSTDDAGDAAGAGGQPGPHEPLGASGIDFAEGLEEVVLPWNEGEGRRVSVEVEPEAHPVPLAPSDAFQPAGDQERAHEAAMRREAVGGAFRQVIMGYFLPSVQATPGMP